MWISVWTVVFCLFASEGGDDDECEEFFGQSGTNGGA